MFLTATKRPISTEEKTTPKKALIQATKLNLSIFHIRVITLMSTKLITAYIMMEASIAFGVYLNNRVMVNSNVSSTIDDITILDTTVLHPAM
ncbi:hypothetical protein ES319_D13G060900v1 [Gossypium barbadense]|uniref:Uncharacterized protein n=1 Tax=Gossypium barbadense TaxID=3634 RepID=A0A5J5NIP6_GOSBA|nr:hypothetical protein ES319_D13G060900v1 [Gossypium barbadense]